MTETTPNNLPLKKTHPPQVPVTRTQHKSRS